MIADRGDGEVCEYEVFIAWARGNLEARENLDTKGGSAESTDSPVR